MNADISKNRENFGSEDADQGSENRPTPGLHWTWIVSGLLVLISFGISAVLYPHLPDQIPIHWNINGEADGYGDKQWALFLTPGMMLVFLATFWLLPWLSPKNFEVSTFRETYLVIMGIMMGMFAYIHVISLMGAFNKETDVARGIVGGILVALALLGNLLGKVKRNFYVGIRTPWTLANDRVWADTHRLGAWMFTGLSLLGLVLVIVGLPPWIAFVFIIMAALIPALYSLVRYKQLERAGKL